ncbi:HPP family protein [Amycolatopsis sp. NPDC059657]|uniref:CBS domain-containing protein n=1 Tax=Amycolatopsis sp. NPDC059657 TaxID=3346899 RepID=UPI00366B75E3
MRVSEVMSTPTIAVTPAATADEAAAVMTANGVTTLPVVDQQGKLLGLLTEEDIIRTRYLSDPRSQFDADSGVLLRGHAKVGSLLREACGTRPDTELAELAARMVELRMRSVPVLDGDHVIGMVTWRDLLRALADNPQGS